MKKAYISSNGCPESLLDSARVKRYLEENGWQIVNNPAADVELAVFYSCALTDEAVNGALAAIREIKCNIEREGQVVVWGCLPIVAPEKLKGIYNGTVFGERNFYKLAELIRSKKSPDETTANEVCVRYRKKDNVREKITRIPLRLINFNNNRLNKKINLHRPDDPSIFYIKVSTGCLGQCTYCSVRLSRGKIQSKPIDKVMAEFRDGLKRGFKNFSLLGTDLGSYGRDLGYTLVDLFREIFAETGDYQIGLRNINPYFLHQMLDDLDPFFATGKIWYIEIPIESGSDRILELMGRPYTVENVKASMRKLKIVAPSLKIRTQVMVGFPTETNNDFQKSMEFLTEVKPDFVEVYRFSPRLGTVAEKMDGRVSLQTVRLREYRILIRTEISKIIKTFQRGSD